MAANVVYPRFLSARVADMFTPTIPLGVSITISYKPTRYAALAKLFPRQGPRCMQMPRKKESIFPCMQLLWHAACKAFLFITIIRCMSHEKALKLTKCYLNMFAETGISSQHKEFRHLSALIFNIIVTTPLTETDIAWTYKRMIQTLHFPLDPVLS